MRRGNNFFRGFTPVRVMVVLLGLLLALSACSRAPAGSIIHKIPVSGGEEGDLTVQPGQTYTAPGGAPAAAGAPTLTATVATAADQAGFRIDYPSKPALPDGALNITYKPLVFLVSGGFSPYLFSINKGVLPAGMAFSRDGQLTGRPTETGDFAFTVEVVDGLFFFPHVLRKDYTLHVGIADIPVYVTDTVPPWPIISPTSPPGKAAPRPPTATPIPPAATPVPVIINTDTPPPPPTSTPLPPPTATRVPPTATPLPPTRTPRPTHTPRVDTPTPVPLPTNTPLPPPPVPTDTPLPPPAPTDTAVPPPAPTDTAVPPPAPTDTVLPPPG